MYSLTGLWSKDVLNISLPVVSGCLQALFCKSSDMATCLEQIFGRATELHDGEITMPWHDLQWYNEIILTSPQTTRMSILSAPTSCRSLIESVLYRSTRRAFHSSKSCCLPAKCVFTSFFNIAVNTTTSGRQQPNRTDSFCRTVVSSHWRRSTCGGSRQQHWEGQKIYREETWLCQKHFELQQNVSRTYPDIRLFQFCYDFCDTSSDHCDTRTILQRTKIYLKLFAVNDGWREAITDLLIFLYKQIYKLIWTVR